MDHVKNALQNIATERMKHSVQSLKHNLERSAHTRNLIDISYDCSVRLRDFGAPLRRQEGVRRLPEGIHQHQGRAGRDGACEVGFTA